MWRKRLLPVILIVSIVILGGCKDKAVDNIDKGAINDKPAAEDSNQDEDNSPKDSEKAAEKPENIEIGKVILNKLDNSIRIGATTSNGSRGPIYDIQWSSDDSLVFAYDYNENNTNKTTFYNYNTSSEELKETFKIEEEVWQGHIVNDGNGLIYSSNGFDGLYYVDKNGSKTNIMKAQSWYHISPDGKRIVINGIPADESDNSEYRSYIYDIESSILVENLSIPPMDYVFSYIAATWSPNSIHISSQTGDKEDTLEIINAIENSVEKEIKIEDSIISLPVWSEDGKKIAFLVQSKENSKYLFEDGEMYFRMSDTIGIYSIEDKAVEYFELNGALAINGMLWSSNNDGIFIQTVEKTEGDKIIDNSIEGSKTIKIFNNYLDLSSGNINELFEGTATTQYGYIPYLVYPVGLYDNEVFLYSQEQDGQFQLKAFNLRDKTDKVIFENTYYIDKWYDFGERKIYTATNGIYEVDKDFNVIELESFNNYDDNDIVFISATLSPSGNKAVIEIQYSPGISKKNFIDIIEL